MLIYLFLGPLKALCQSLSSYYSEDLILVYFETQKYFLMNIYFRGARKIEFRSLSDLNQIIHTFSAGSIDPGASCAASASTLLFVDHSKEPSDVYWLDCNEDEPKLTGKKISINLGHVWDMCFVPNERKSPLFVTQYGLSAVAYSTVTNKLEWNSLGGGSCITTDCHNYLMGLEGDRINMISLSDGKKLGYLMRNGDQGLGKLKHVRWCNMTSSLIVVHDVDKEIHISTIQFE